MLFAAPFGFSISPIVCHQPSPAPSCRSPAPALPVPEGSPLILGGGDWGDLGLWELLGMVSARCDQQHPLLGAQGLV